LGEDGNARNYKESKKYGVSATTVCTTVMKNDYSVFVSVPNKTVTNKMCIKNNVTANLSSGGTDFLIVVS
jgi:uncharacterized protein YmfQ (DUF2313 family)